MDTFAIPRSRKTVLAGLLVLALGALGLILTRALAGSERICFEAEKARKIVEPLKKIRDKNVSGGFCLGTDEGACKDEPRGEALISFQVAQTGTYYLWLRGWWYDDCGNSFGVVIDDYPLARIGEDGTKRKWHWVKGTRYYLEEGAHTLVLKVTEDGARADEILLTTDPDWQPRGEQKPTQ